MAIMTSMKKKMGKQATKKKARPLKNSQKKIELNKKEELQIY
jgi:hypothetical protein